jgi:hypothetical protein
MFEIGVSGFDGIGTGSTPAVARGWQRDSRRRANTNPRPAPWIAIASIA